MKSPRSTWRNITRFGTLFVINIAVLALLGLGFGREYLRNLEIERSIRALEAENTALGGQQLESLSVIQSLSSEYYLEGEARKKHGLAKPGEELVVLKNDDEATRSAALMEEKTVGNPERWYQYFFAPETFAAIGNL